MLLLRYDTTDLLTEFADVGHRGHPPDDLVQRVGPRAREFRRAVRGAVVPLAALLPGGKRVLGVAEPAFRDGLRDAAVGERDPHPAGLDGAEPVVRWVVFPPHAGGRVPH